MNQIDSTGTAGAFSDNKRRLLDLCLQGRLETGRSAELRIGPRPAGALAPLSFEQELIWIHSKLAPELPLYNEILTVRRTGTLDVPALERSLSEIVRRHEAWRTTFDAIDGEARQVIQPPQRFSLPVCDLSSLPQDEREREAARLATEEAQRPLDLVRGPVVRAKLVRMAQSEHRLYVIVHQIVHDGVSVYSVFLPELIALYEAFAAGKPSPLADIDVQYADFSAWQRGARRDDRGAASLEYWRRQLAGAPSALELPTDKARPKAQTFRGGQHAFALPKPLTDALKLLSQREQTTLFATLLAAFKVLLHRYTGEEDICVGTAISTRRVPQVERLLGVFLNTIVLRTRVAEALSFHEVLSRVRQVVVEGLSHGDVPFLALVKDLHPKRDPGHNPLFQVTFVLEPPMPAPQPGWEMTQMDVGTGVARVDLYLQMDDRPEGLVGHIRYNADLWEAPTITRLAEHFVVLLEGLVADPELAIASIPILTEAERLIVGRNPGDRRPSNAYRAFDASAIEQSVPHRFARQVAEHSTRVAVRDGRTEWTYAELNQAANRVAHALASSQLAAGRRVALLLDHDASMVAGLFGVLKSGGAYVPLDPTHPEERLRRILTDADASVVLTSRKNLALARQLAVGSTAVLEIEDLLRTGEAPEYGTAASADGLAYLLYTSGSTGRPKGVAQNHRNLLHFIAAYTNNLHLSSGDRLTLLSSYGVDAAVMDIFGALLNGATLCPIDVREVGLGGVCERVLQDGVTVYHSTPTLYRHVVRALAGLPRPATVRLVVLGGEEVRDEDVAVWRERFAPHCILVNGFGPTESTVSLQYFVDMQAAEDGTSQRSTTLPSADVPSAGARRSVPIGRPVERTKVSLLSREGRPGQVYGEIAIVSPHVALGYWQSFELTKAAFLPDASGGKNRIYKTGDMGRLLSDGNIEFRGRRDLQTKIQGFRVEIGEVETALSQYPGVKGVAATVWEPADGERRLIAYFVASPGSTPSHDELRAFLRRRLPVHMVPSAFVRLDALPLTPSGKLDRRALPTPEVQVLKECAEPSSSLERQLTVIWKSVLGVDRIGTKDDFFELGGHSLLALRMMAEIKNKLGVNLPLATLLEAPTIERLAEFLQSQGIAAPSQPPPNALGASSPSRSSLVGRIASAVRTSAKWPFSRWSSGRFAKTR